MVDRKKPLTSIHVRMIEKEVTKKLYYMSFRHLLNASIT